MNMPKKCPTCDSPEARDAAIAVMQGLVEALKAHMAISRVNQPPRKLDEALTWRQNDDAVQAMCIAALAAAQTPVSGTGEIAINAIHQETNEEAYQRGHSDGFHLGQSEQTGQKIAQQAEELYKRAFDDGAMATQIHLESLRVSQLEQAISELKSEHQKVLSGRVVKYQALLSKCEELTADIKARTENQEYLRQALREARKVLVVACGETAPYIKIALARIDTALPAFLGKE